MIQENTPRMETERLILRRFAEDDIPAILDVFGDVEANRFLPWFPLKSLDEAAAFYRERFAAVYARPSGCMYAICFKGGDVPIGYIHADADPPHDFGYALATPYWHRGITTEAGRAVIERVRAAGWPFLTATHDVNNPRSGAVMRKLGMRYAYSYREHWMPKDISVVYRMYQINLDGQDGRVDRTYWERFPEHFVEEGI